MDRINIRDKGFKLSEFVITFNANILQLPCELLSFFELFNTPLAFLGLVTAFPINIKKVDKNFN